MKTSKIIRVDRIWEKKAKDIMKERYDKGLAKFNIQEVGLPEFTRLQMRCPSWPLVESELRNLPKGKSNGKK